MSEDHATPGAGSWTRLSGPDMYAQIYRVGEQASDICLGIANRRSTLFCPGKKIIMGAEEPDSEAH